MKYVYSAFVLLAVLAFALVVFTGVASAHFGASYINHFKMGLLATVLGLFVHALMFIYFISSHKAIKEALKKRDLDGEEGYIQETRDLKMETMPWATLGMLLLIGTTLLGGAADVGDLPNWTHWASTPVTIGVNLYLYWFEWQKINENVDLIHRVDATLNEHDDRTGSETDAPERERA